MGLSNGLDISNLEEKISKRVWLIDYFLTDFLVICLFHLWFNLWLDSNYSLTPNKLEKSVLNSEILETNLFNEMLAFQTNELKSKYPGLSLVFLINQERESSIPGYRKSFSKYSKEHTEPAHFLFSSHVYAILDALKREIKKSLGLDSRSDTIIVDVLSLHPVFLAGLLRISTCDISQWILSLSDKETGKITEQLESIHKEKENVEYQKWCKKTRVFLEKYGFGCSYLETVWKKQMTSWFNDAKEIRKEFDPKKIAEEIWREMEQIKERIIREKGGLSREQQEAFEKFEKSWEEFKKSKNGTKEYFLN